MAGSIFFSRRSWAANYSMTWCVMEFLADRAPDPVTRAEIRDRVDNNVSMLDLAPPERAPLVDLIADELLNQPPPYEDPDAWRGALELLRELVDCARDQQEFNATPNPERYYQVGPNPAKHFRLDDVIDYAISYLDRADSVRIDVSGYTPQQHGALRDRLAELAYPHLSIVNDT